MVSKHMFSLAGMSVPCCFSFEYNRKRYYHFFKGNYVGDDALCITDQEKQIYEKAYPDDPWGPPAESKLMIMLVSDYLLSKDRLIFHSVAFLWNNKAWLLTAPSGTGKTTMYRHLKKSFGDEIQIICGDNPVLHFQENGVIMVYPSPWNGKENYGGDTPGPLEGIIYLEQADVNQISVLPPQEAVIPVFEEMNTFSRTPQMIHSLARLEERMLNTVPVWHFKNNGTKDAADLLMQHLIRHDKTEHMNGLQD